MRYQELIAEGDILNEMPWGGATSFGGFGQGIFRRAHYNYIADAISEVDDEQAKEFLANWFADIFSKDSARFKPEQFKKAAMSGCHVGSTPTFQSRHFYYLATLIHRVSDQHIREFLTTWTGELIGRTNEDFKQNRWKHFCETGQKPSERRFKIRQTETGRWVNPGHPDYPWKPGEEEVWNAQNA